MNNPITKIFEDGFEMKLRNDKFHVKSTLKYLDTIRQCGGCSDAVSTRIISSREAFRELLPTLANLAILTKQGNVYMCVWKVLLYGSKFWPVVTGDVPRLVTADNGMIKWICDVSLKDRIPTTDLSLCLGISSINDAALEPTEVPWTLVTYRW